MRAEIAIRGSSRRESPEAYFAAISCGGLNPASPLRCKRRSIHRAEIGCARLRALAILLYVSCSRVEGGWLAFVAVATEGLFARRARRWQTAVLGGGRGCDPLFRVLAQLTSQRPPLRLPIPDIRAHVEASAASRRSPARSSALHHRLNSHHCLGQGPSRMQAAPAPPGVGGPSLRIQADENPQTRDRRRVRHYDTSLLVGRKCVQLLTDSLQLDRTS